MARKTPSRRRLRSTFDSVFLHEMKNVGFRLGLLLSNVEEHFGDPEFKRSVMDLLQSTILKVDAAVEKLAEHHDSVLIKFSLDLSDLLQEAIREARSREALADGRPAARPAVRVELGEIVPVWGDAAYLRDAFLSVLQNAMEAAGSGGTVAVRTWMEEPGARRRIVVEIEDDGPGMSEEFVKNRLFHPFQTTKSHGVGLGLYTAREIVRFHRGRIDVRSDPGRGTLVRITFPAPREKSEA